MDWDLPMGYFLPSWKWLWFFFFKDKQCEKSLHYIKKKLWTLYRFEYKMIHVMELLLWSAMLVQDIKENHCLENDQESFQSDQSYCFCSFNISQLLRHFRTQLSIPKCSLPQELVRGRLELYSLHSMPQQGTI